jgi:hypothetical protein
MTPQPPRPLTDPPRPQPRPTTPDGEDHRRTLAGGARYAICNRSRPATLPGCGSGFDRARSQQHEARVVVAP